MKTSISQSLIRIAAVAVFAVLGTFMFMKSAKASDTVTFTQTSLGDISCTTQASNTPQPGTSCSDNVKNTGAAGGESLSWTSISVSPTSAWLSVSPTQSSNPIAPGGSEAVTYTVSTGLNAGTYNATVTFNGESNTPSGPAAVTADTVTVQFNVDLTGGCQPGDPNCTSCTSGDNCHYCVTGDPNCTTCTSGNDCNNCDSNGVCTTCDSSGDCTPSIGQPVNPTATNTTANPAVACDTIQLNWGAGHGADSYDVYRNGSALLTHYPGLAYTDTAVSPGTSYAYTIRSYSASLGTTAFENFTPSSIQPTACLVDLSLSDDLVNTVNQQPYPYSSSCVGSQSGTATVIQQFELVELRIDVCNRGTASAQNVMLTSTFDPTSNHTTATTGSGQTTPSNTNGETLTWNLGTISPNTNKTVFTYIFPDAGTNVSQTLQRFINTATITYTSAGGNVSPVGCIGNYADSGTPCIVSTGYVPFTTTGNNSATQQEIKP